MLLENDQKRKPSKCQWLFFHLLRLRTDSIPILQPCAICLDRLIHHKFSSITFCSALDNLPRTVWRLESLHMRRSSEAGRIYYSFVEESCAYLFIIKIKTTYINVLDWGFSGSEDWTIYVIDGISSHRLPSSRAAQCLQGLYDGSRETDKVCPKRYLFLWIAGKLAKNTTIWGGATRPSLLHMLVFWLDDRHGIYISSSCADLTNQAEQNHP